MIRVMIADDHAFVRSQLAKVLRAQDGIEVVGQCGDGADVLELATSALPDLVLMDVRMPLMSGTVATRNLLTAWPMIRVVMLTGSMNYRVVEESRSSGALGFLLKDGDSDCLIRAVRIVAAGGTAWPAVLPDARRG